MASTFSGFYVARSGIQAARANLQITGQNMTNVNSKGYTRQRVDCYSVGSSKNNMRYANPSELAIGEGVNCDGISQLRDPYLDVRYRMEHAKTGKTGTELNTLNDLETVFDEAKKKGISTQLQDLTTQLQSLAGSSSDLSLENIVKNSSLLLTKAFNNAAQQISKIRKQQTDSFQSNAVTKANNLLKNIAHINAEIKSADVSGTPALELKDQRNAMLDELSQYADIQITSKNVPVGAGREVPEMVINLVSGDKKFNLVSNDQYNQFDVVKDVTTGTPPVTVPVTLTLKTTGLENVVANDGVSTFKNEDATNGVFKGYLSMLNSEGEFDKTAGADRGIGYYEKVLDKLASEFAGMMNKANSTNAAGDNKPMFTTTDGNLDGITASNISISKEWNEATSSYITSTKQNSTPGIDDPKPGDNILYMINQFTKEKTFTTNPDNSASGSTTLFTSSISSFVTNVSVSVLALQVQDASRQDETYNLTLDEIDGQRAAISAVDINEEGINLIMFNQSLTASSRFMTTMDEAMDTIINKMGVVGR